MTKENYQDVTQEPYLVSWKADGTRYLMLITKLDGDARTRTFLIGRDNTAYD